VWLQEWLDSLEEPKRGLGYEFWWVRILHCQKMDDYWSPDAYRSVKERYGIIRRFIL